jgi:hypothetical protein
MLGAATSLGTASASPVDGPPDVAQYTRSVHTIRASLDAPASSRAAGRADIERIRRQLRALSPVRLPDGRILLTNTPSLAEELSPGDTASIQRVASEIDRLDDALRRQTRTTANSSRLGQLDAVLRDPRFHPRESLRQRLEDWIGGIVYRLLSQFVGQAGVSPLVGTVFAVLFLALVAAVAFLAARGALRRMVVEAAGNEEAGEPTRSGTAQERAAELRSAGDYRTALRYLFLATMLGLQERGALTLRPGVTNREYLAGLRQDSRQPAELEEALQELVDDFDRVWYGHLPLDGAGYARCEELARRALAAVQGERAA